MIGSQNASSDGMQDIPGPILRPGDLYQNYHAESGFPHSFKIKRWNHASFPQDI